MLAIDCGNTRIKWAHYERSQIVARGAAPLQGEGDPFAALANALRPEVGRVLVANVAGDEVAARIAATATTHLGLAPEFVAVARRAGGIECAYRDPSRLGIDRWMALIAGRRHIVGPFAVVSAGTAVTFDAVDRGGRHLGGLILPGDRLIREALAANTGRIGAVESAGEAVEGSELLGRSTEEAVSRGSWLALAAAVDRALTDVGRTLRAVPALLVTGGDGEALMRWLESEGSFRADLVLEGLAALAADQG
jgi:type III pantothenate kinase